MQPTDNFESQPSEDLSVGDLFYKFVPYWPVFAGLLIVSLFSAWLYLRYKTPVYLTTASILIKEEKTSNPGQQMLDAFDLFGTKKNVENEIEVLKSKTLMQEVVENLHLYAPVTIVGRVTSQSGYIASPIVIEAQSPDSIIGANSIQFNFDQNSSIVHIGTVNYNLNQWYQTSFGILRFLPNKYYKIPLKENRDNRLLFSLVSVKNMANRILGTIKIAASSKESTVIDLNIVGEIPQQGEDILNSLLKVYNNAAILDKNELAANTLKFVEDRLKYVVNELDSVEGKLQSFKSRNKITDVSSQGQIFLQSVATNDQKLNDVNMQLAILDQVEKYVKSKEGTGAIAPATLGLPDPGLSDLLQKLAGIELEYTQMKSIVPENNPSITSLVDGINKLKKAILENMQNQRRNLEAGRNDLQNVNASYNSMLESIPEKERELLQISRQQAIKNNIYTFLLQKREETALSFASAVADSRVIDHAESSDGPVSPKRSLVLLIAVIAPLLISVGFVYGREILTRTVQERTDIEKYLKVPFLGEVNFEKTKSAVVIDAAKRSYVAEQFRQLRTSLGYMGIDETHKTIMVTSSISGEGKSFVAINLAISLALKDKKVILLELDLRKPKVSDLLGISRNIGITNYLVGRMQGREIIKSTGYDNLSLIPSGPIPPNPSELISNGKLNELITELNETYDYIIIDTTPVSPVTDAYLISPMADITLFIVRYDYTPKMILQRLAIQQQMSNLKNPAIIYNGLKGKGFAKYGYGYAYSYGYTQDEDKKPWLNIFKKRKR
jgi:tyrosine-protein kinase Etk/Wzc